MLYVSDGTNLRFVPPANKEASRNVLQLWSNNYLKRACARCEASASSRGVSSQQSNAIAMAPPGSMANAAIASRGALLGTRGATKRRLREKAASALRFT